MPLFSFHVAPTFKTVTPIRRAINRRLYNENTIPILNPKSSSTWHEVLDHFFLWSQLSQLSLLLAPVSQGV